MKLLNRKARQPRRAAESATPAPGISRPLVATSLAAALAVGGVVAVMATSSNGSAMAFAGDSEPVAAVSAEPTVSIEDLAAQRSAKLAATATQVNDQLLFTASDARSGELNQDAAAIAKEIDRLENLAKFLWPTKGQVGSPWGMRFHPILHYSRLHAGADIGGKCGQPIYAAQSGTVNHAEAGYNGGSGNNVRIDHGEINGAQVETAYLHMSEFSVSVGQKVTKGQQIGKVGNTGLSTACHLHFSAYKNGQNVDPMEWAGWNKEATRNSAEAVDTAAREAFQE